MNNLHFDFRLGGHGMATSKNTASGKHRCVDVHTYRYQYGVEGYDVGVCSCSQASCNTATNPHHAVSLLLILPLRNGNVFKNTNRSIKKKIVGAQNI